jgi:hypothetical protein
MKTSREQRLLVAMNHTWGELEQRTERPSDQSALLRHLIHHHHNNITPTPQGTEPPSNRAVADISPLSSFTPSIIITTSHQRYRKESNYQATEQLLM